MLERIRRLFHPINGSAEPAPDDSAILVCEFRGVIRNGSSGNSAVDEMARTIERALTRGGFRAILLDISGVRYTFGDHAFGLLMNLRHPSLDLVLVASEQCSHLGTFVERIGGWTVCKSRGEALEKLHSARTQTGSGTDSLTDHENGS